MCAGNVATGGVALVQEEVSGALWRFHFARCGGRIAYVAVRTLADYPFRVGESTVSRFMPAPPELAAVARALLETVGYDGIGSLGFLRARRVVPGTRHQPAHAREPGRHDRRRPRHATPGRRDRSGTGACPRAGAGAISPVRAAARRARGNSRCPPGAPTGRPVGRIAGGIVLAAVLPGRMLHPLDLVDPLPTLAVLARAVGRVSPEPESPPALATRP